MSEFMKDMDRIVQAVATVLKPEAESRIPLHEPQFNGSEWKYVKECLDTGWVSSVGKYVDEFEKRLEEITGVRKAVAVVNGTAALHICLKLVDVNPEDEVLIPALSFVATANAVSHCGATPHFIDSSEATLGVDPEKLEGYLGDIAKFTSRGIINRKTGKHIKAVVAMHTFGHPVDLDALSSVCQSYGLPLIEDAAESLGSYYKGRHTGGWGTLSALSFNGNKIVTTGGGGAILTNDEEMGKLAKHITTTAKVPHPWCFFHDMVGYNYRLPNLNAALGCAQLEQLPDFLVRKRELAAHYRQAFSTLPGVRFFSEPNFAKSNYWLNVLLLDTENQKYRDELIKRMHQRGFIVRPAWDLLHQLPMYHKCSRMDLSVAEGLVARLINLPSGAGLVKADI